MAHVLRRWLPRLRTAFASEQGQHMAVVTVVLGPDAARAGKLLDLVRIDYAHPRAGLVQKQRQCLVVDAGGLNDEAQLLGGHTS